PASMTLGHVNIGAVRCETALETDAKSFEIADAGGSGESVRCWSCSEVAVVVGRSGRVDREVDEAACAQDGVPILRRVSGGGAVVIGPGCLNYALVLSLAARPELKDVALSYKLILGRIVESLGLAELSLRGMSDLVLNDRKVSGCAQRRGRNVVL